MDSVTLFADTNAFLQLRDLKDLKWRALFPKVKHVRIIVAKAVIEELGKHKNSGNDRRRNRARLALQQIVEASKAVDRTLTLKDGPVRITLETPRIKRPDWDALDDLDPNSPDDRLVAAAFTYGNGAAVFSHDTGPQITAHDLGLDAYEPLEDWHLAPEQSDSDRKIALLERQLKAAQSTKPELAIEIERRDEAGKLSVYRPILPPLESEEVERLLNRYLEEHPRGSPVATNRYFAVAMDNYLSAERVDEYHSDYDSFAHRVKEFLQKLHELSYYLVVPMVGVRTTNNGSVSATNFHVTLEASGGFGLMTSAKTIRKMVPFPEPPKVPEPHNPLRPLLGHDLLRGGMIPAPPHPTEIVWIDKPKLGESYGRYGCADFQPQRTELRSAALWPNDTLPVTGVLTVTAGANDVADISESVEVTIEEREEPWYSPQVVESLPKFLQTELRALKLGGRQP